MIDLNEEKLTVSRATLSSYAIGWNDSIDNIKSKYNIITAPRTETDIINELKALGWRYQPQRLSYEYKFYNKGNVIEIRGGDKVIAYEEKYFPDDEPNYQPICIDYDVYKLIFELLNLEE